MPTLAAISNRQANRAAARAYRQRLTAARVSAPPPPASTPAATELTADELLRIRDALIGTTCTTTWAESITDILQQRKPSGKRVIPYSITEDGRLKTKLPRLLEMIADAMVYPPTADDNERCGLRPRTYHIGSQMMACYCHDCRGQRWWPAGYIVDGWISYTCSVNRKPLDDDSIPGGKYLTMQQVAERVVYDPDAWRKDAVGKLWKNDPDACEETVRWIVSRLRAHRWRQVVGSKPARLISRGLASVGALADFVYLGHSLKPVVGDHENHVISKINSYSREPRRAGVRVEFQKTK